MPDPHVVRMFAVWQFSDGTYDTNITNLGSVGNRRPSRQVMAGSPDQVRTMVEVFLKMAEMEQQREVGWHNWLLERAEDAAIGGLKLDDALQAVREGYSSVEADRDAAAEIIEMEAENG